MRVPVIVAGVQVSTAYLLCPKSTIISTIQRAALQIRAACHTALTTLFTGGAARGIINPAMRELGVPTFPLAVIITLLRAAAEQRGLSDFQSR